MTPRAPILHALLEKTSSNECNLVFLRVFASLWHFFRSANHEDTKTLRFVRGLRPNERPLVNDNMLV